MDIDKMIGELREAERKCLIDALTANGGSYEWPAPEDGEDDDNRPWATIYIADEVWHGIKVQKVERAREREDSSFLWLHIVGDDYAGCCCGHFDRIVSACELILGDCYEIASHMP